MSNIRELDTIEQIHAILNVLSNEEKVRILDWVNDFFG
jgi:hypothetical protein